MPKFRVCVREESYFYRDIDAGNEAEARTIANSEWPEDFRLEEMEQDWEISDIHKLV